MESDLPEATFPVDVEAVSFDLVCSVEKAIAKRSRRPAKQKPGGFFSFAQGENGICSNLPKMMSAEEYKVFPVRTVIW